jgi:hypothetical protein
MRLIWILAVLAMLQPAVPRLEAQISPLQLVRETVYNELHDHDRHGFWRYWVEHHKNNQVLTEEQVETVDGPVKRLARRNGRPLDAAAGREEQKRLEELIHSPAEQARQHQDYLEDERRIGRILALLPDAFVYQDAGEFNGCRHLSFRPNPSYPPHSVEARIFHAMSGELWISADQKRLVRLDGHLEENLDFGFGILGRLYKGGWFRLERTAASASDWKTQRLEVHMNGRALLFKTVARETSEVRGGFQPVPARMSIAQGVALLEAGNPPASNLSAAMER